MEIIQNVPLSIKFIIDKKKSKSSNEYLLYARILLNRDKALISLKTSLKEADWDHENGQFKTTTKYNQARNTKLGETSSKIFQIYQALKKSGATVSAKNIKKAYDGKVTTFSDMAFMTYYNKYVEELKEKPDEYGEGVLGHYNKVKTHLERFLKLKGWERLKLSQLSGKFLERFENYLLVTPNAQKGKPMNNNTASTYIRKVKACLNAAVRRELIPTNPFQNFKIKPFKTANRVSLTTEEIELLRTHDLGDNAALQRVRDTFIFCCATGLRHSDGYQLDQSMVKMDNDGIYWISLFQKKTKDYIEIPMSDVALEIYNRFESHRRSTGKVLPMLTNQKVNSYLKVIADLTGIKKRLTFHAARHTFATNSLENGVDIASISSFLGHRTIKTTQIYAKMTRKRKVDVIRHLNEQNVKYRKG